MKISSRSALGKAENDTRLKINIFGGFDWLKVHKASILVMTNISGWRQKNSPPFKLKKYSLFQN